jgi:hypothetical protein
MNLHRLRLPRAPVVAALSVVALSLPAAAQNPVSRVSVDGSGAQGNGDSGILSHCSISQDGRWLAFESQASNLVSGDTNGVADIFVKDLATGAIVRPASRRTGGSSRSRASPATSSPATRTPPTTSSGATATPTPTASSTRATASRSA